MIFHSFQDFLDLLKGQKFNIFDYFKFKNLKYNILSVGQNCFPRVICSFAKLKPTKIYGELTCPFDLAYYFDINSVIKLIDSDFENFFDNVVFDEKENTYVNFSFFINFVHDGNLSKEKFVERYTKRIENFHYYMNSEKPLILMFYASSQITEKQILYLYDIICKKRKEKFFRLIIAHHSEIRMKDLPKGLLLIENIDISKLEQNSASWVKLMRPKFRKNNIEAKDIYSRVTKTLNQAIKEIGG
ncbi:hypothetical protein IJG72_02295 [bacterium]|nr:hypothetical protein [bacterium]